MSMRNYPASGYIVKLDDLKSAIAKALSGTGRELFLEDLETNMDDTDNMLDILGEGAQTIQLPAPESVFQLTESDDADEDLDQNTWYVTFYEADLFVRTPTAELTRMESLKIKPELRHWSIYA